MSSIARKFKRKPTDVPAGETTAEGTEAKPIQKPPVVARPEMGKNVHVAKNANAAPPKSMIPRSGSRGK